MRRPGAPIQPTRPNTDEDLPSDQVLAALIVIGDARRLGGTRRVLPIRDTLEIGRQPDAEGGKAWIVDDDRVSRRHAEVRADPRRGWAEIVDLGSRNGTMVDGSRIDSTPRPLKPGSMIFIGAHAAVFRFLLASDLEAIAADGAHPFTPVATTSPELARRCQILRHLARGNDDLLIIGETGVGKEEFARAVHQNSGRTGKFVAINCPALPGTLIESELFGYTRGAHSQATRDKPGLIDEAERGTLFLDEFAEISHEVQAKLLRFLENRTFLPLGSTRPRQVDVRVLAATNRELSALRQDIAARLGPEPITLPPLCAHPEDIAALAGHFLRDRARPMELELPAFQAICLHDWPDNVRGLKKSLGRAADLAASQGRTTISLKDLPAGISRRDATGPATSPASDSTAEIPPTARRSPRAAPTKEELEALLERHGWVVSRAARELDRHHAVLWRWIKRYGLDATRVRPEPDSE